MNQDLANLYISQTGTLLCLDVPEKAEFGIDINCWVVGNMFKGIKLIPLGLHLIYMKYVLPSPSEGLTFSLEGGHRFSFFINITKTALVVVKRWNPQTETFFDEIDEEEAERYCIGVKNFDFDKYLGTFVSRA